MSCRIKPFAGEEEQSLFVQLRGDSSWMEPAEFFAESDGLRRAGAVESEAEAEKIVPEFCILFAERALPVACVDKKKD